LPPAREPQESRALAAVFQPAAFHDIASSIEWQEAAFHHRELFDALRERSHGDSVPCAPRADTNVFSSFSSQPPGGTEPRKSRLLFPHSVALQVYAAGELVGGDPQHAAVDLHVEFGNRGRSTSFGTAIILPQRPAPVSMTAETAQGFFDNSISERPIAENRLGTMVSREGGAVSRQWAIHDRMAGESNCTNWCCSAEDVDPAGDLLQAK
jgi:hypothetical protein